MRPPDDVREELVREWLDLAEEDLTAAAEGLAEGKPYLRVLCFHAQQAAEKYLKAYLVKHSIEPPRTHDIEELLDLVARLDTSLSANLQPAIDLTTYAVDARYPGHLTPMTPNVVRRAVELATMVQQAVLAALASAPS